MRSIISMILVLFSVAAGLILIVTYTAPTDAWWLFDGESINNIRLYSFITIALVILLFAEMRIRRK